jgi:RND family efflux transporter MFP subunit
MSTSTHVRLLAFTAVTVVTSLGVLAYKLRAPAKRPIATAATSATSVTPVVPADLELALQPVKSEEFVGVLVPPEAADLASRQEGKLTDVRVKVGERVKRDGVLAVFDTRMLKSEMGIAQAQLGQAADRARRRSGSVNVAGASFSIVSDEDRTASQFETGAAAARVQALKAAIELSEIRAPFDGVVTVVYTSAGNYTKAGVPIVRVIGNSNLRLRYCVPDDAKKPPLRSKVMVHLRDLRPLHATVESVSPEVEPTSHCVFVDASLDDLPPDCKDNCTQLAARTVRVTNAPTGEK